MRAPRVGVLALQGDVREHDRALRAAGAEPVHVRRVADLDGLDGLILPGGESTTISRLLGLFDLIEPLRSAVADGLPVYGSCAGMILLASAVLDGRPDQQGIGGLDIVVRRNAFGRQVDSFETDLAFTGVGDVHAVFIRAPWVESAGEAVQVLARVPEGNDPGGSPVAGRVVAVRQGALLATSFHPELTGDDRVHALFVDIVRRARG
ncbi:MAG: pyridoxal 5'-phosphate synthase glutaminase subunit PdxT [Actinobacteria bacterium]|nr:pyridoxal 5'-phosphate synthase glutaminase subunit PdxT [Actinomycetota bacterium]MBW3647342.1 pyridoxal 5'-phosphate synthase glutaminase subunit PdxT [Actinomycetota bacterium]